MECNCNAFSGRCGRYKSLSSTPHPSAVARKKKSIRSYYNLIWRKVPADRADRLGALESDLRLTYSFCPRRYSKHLIPKYPVRLAPVALSSEGLEKPGGLTDAASSSNRVSCRFTVLRAWSAEPPGPFLQPQVHRDHILPALKLRYRIPRSLLYSLLFLSFLASAPPSRSPRAAWSIVGRRFACRKPSPIDRSCERRPKSRGDSRRRLHLSLPRPGACVVVRLSV